MADKEDDKEDKPAKPAKITKKEWAKVEAFLEDELQARKTSQFRVTHENQWKEIDRQIQMTPMVKINRDGSKEDPGWHNVIELGELAKASENIAADVTRIVFPQSRFWFEAYADIEDEIPISESGEKKPIPKLSERVNGRLRALMMQQHADFGNKDRVELSVKEALHHGGFVVEVDWCDQEMIYEGTKTKTRGAPVWVPHSMWNCYPDSSPSVIGSNMFYEGSMFIESYTPRYKAERMVKQGTDGWMPGQWKKVPEDEHQIKDQTTKDVKLITYWGDINIARSEGDLYYPNHKAILMNGVIVYMAPNETPYPPIIYRGYERQDVRDPYYTSPIIKQSPMQKLASTLANKMMDGVELALEPPIVYDGNDPDFVLNGGPVIAPGAKVSTKGANSFETIKIGDVGVALSAMEFCLNEMKEKLGRPGKPVGDRATKAEVVKAEQDQEVSVLDFIGKMEVALRSYLYMQHAMNVDKLREYAFYSPEMLDSDFISVKGTDLPQAAHFEVVGARGVLGEEQRNQKFTAAAAFMAGSPVFAPKMDLDAVALQIFADTGTKNPEHFLVIEGQPNASQLQAQLQQAKQIIQQLNGELQQEKSHNQVKMAKIHSDEQTKGAKIQVDAQLAQQATQAASQSARASTQADFLAKMQKIQADQQSEREARAADTRALMAEMRARFAELAVHSGLEHRKVSVDAALEHRKINAQAQAAKQPKATDA